MTTNTEINLLKSDFQLVHFFSISYIFYILHNNADVFFFLSIERYLFLQSGACSLSPGFQFNFYFKKNNSANSFFVVPFNEISTFINNNHLGRGEWKLHIILRANRPKKISAE